MAIIIFDNEQRNLLYPLSLTKAIADFHFGILTVKERWALSLEDKCFVQTVDYLQNLYEPIPAGDHFWIDARVLPSPELIVAIKGLGMGEALSDQLGLIAFRSAHFIASFEVTTTLANAVRMVHPWDIIFRNDAQIREDFKLVTKGRKSEPISPTVNYVQTADIFIEEGAKIEFCTLNSSTGPIYIGKNAEIMEGTSIRGPFSIGFNSVLKLNSRVYGGTSLGPFCMGGGEIKNTVLMGYSNKGHDGYLGDAIIGEWCNFGAGSSNSNLKNSAGDIQVWSMGLNKKQSAGQKCGVIMGDYSRLAINSSVNTGSVIGVSSTVFGLGLLPSFIPNFSWGVEGKKYRLETALVDINNWKSMKGKQLTEAEINVLKHIFTQ
jgi:UDP-N-acetylglucosamine diphosphorylase / glucose-1-phosphate thymidylyltransferase / UDP-N-acetylgalactosamine diphosphorylase / glucosamine-1-phosphate N-acetyltransferase / galactosamine-1-phosphate N-acetyltransferase